MAQHEPIRKRPAPSQEIPDKLYFRIGEVAKLCEVPAYVLRFWESEFVQLKPNKGGTGQRLYRRRDVETALRVKQLLYDEGYTIAGARQALRSELRAASSSKDPQSGLSVAEADSRILSRMESRTESKTESKTESRTAPVTLDHLRTLQALQHELRELHAMLSRPPVKAAVHPIRGGRPLPVPLTPARPKSTVKPFPKPKMPGLYDSFDSFDRLFDSLPDAERNDPV